MIPRNRLRTGTYLKLLIVEVKHLEFNISLRCQDENSEIVVIAEKFIFANCYSQKIVGEFLRLCSMQEAEIRGDC